MAQLRHSRLRYRHHSVQDIHDGGAILVQEHATDRGLDNVARDRTPQQEANDPQIPYRDKDLMVRCRPEALTGLKIRPASHRVVSHAYAEPDVRCVCMIMCSSVMSWSSLPSPRMKAPRCDGRESNGVTAVRATCAVLTMIRYACATSPKTFPKGFAPRPRSSPEGLQNYQLCPKAPLRSNHAPLLFRPLCGHHVETQGMFLEPFERDDECE